MTRRRPKDDRPGMFGPRTNGFRQRRRDIAHGVGDGGRDRWKRHHERLPHEADHRAQLKHAGQQHEEPPPNQPMRSQPGAGQRVESGERGLAR